MRFTSITAALVLGAVLSACSGEAPGDESKAEADRNAKDEVVGGSISDDMLPLDDLRSQSPHIKEAPAKNGETAPSSEPTASDEEGEAQAAPDEAPADAEPEAEASEN